jgi:hypothetical protein
MLSPLKKGSLNAVEKIASFATRTKKPPVEAASGHSFRAKFVARCDRSKAAPASVRLR